MPAFRISCHADSLEEAVTKLMTYLQLGIIQVADPTPMDLLSDEYAIQRYSEHLLGEGLVTIESHPITNEPQATLSQLGRQMKKACLS